jgi:hypothetical protein
MKIDNTTILPLGGIVYRKKTSTYIAAHMRPPDPTTTKGRPRED